MKYYHGVSDLSQGKDLIKRNSWVLMRGSARVRSPGCIPALVESFPLLCRQATETKGWSVVRRIQHHIRWTALRQPVRGWTAPTYTHARNTHAHKDIYSHEASLHISEFTLLLKYI